MTDCCDCDRPISSDVFFVAEALGGGDFQVPPLLCADWLLRWFACESVCVNRLVRADWYEPARRTGLMEPSCFFCALKRFRRAALLKWS